MASNRTAWTLAALMLVMGCGSAAKRQATQDSLAQVELMARRDSLKKVKEARDLVARVSYAACADSVRKALMKTPAGRAKLRVRVPEGQPRPENAAACGAMPAPLDAPAGPVASAPATPATPTPAATTPARSTTTPAAPTAQQQRVARADSVRQARERARQDSLARVAERKRTDSIARVALDSTRADSAARARDTEVLRETFSYAGAARDPFQSVVSSGDNGPTVGNMILVAVYADARSARNSVAVLRERQGTRRYRVKMGDRIGSATVSLITQRDVTFSIQDFGFERQETLSLRKTTEDTP